MKFNVLVIDHSLQHIEEIKTAFGQNQLAERIYEAGDGAEALEILKAIPDRAHLPVILISSQVQADYKAKAFELGAQEFLIRPFEPEDILMRAKSLVRLKTTYEELNRRIRELEKTAHIDPLTGLFNWKYLLDNLKTELIRSRRYRFTLACLMIDIDNFKTVNDSFGHSVGDHLLKELAQRLSHQMRGYDFAARYGGDEFVVLLPQSSKGGSLALAERLRQVVDCEPFLESEGKNIRLTISIGIAAFSGSEVSSEEQILTISDRALYEAKQVGRNCIAIAESFDQFRVEPPKGLYRRNYRRYQRYPFLTTVKVVDPQTKECTVAYAINISYSGLAMYVQKPMAEKSHVQVWISLTDTNGKPREERVEGVVRWIRQLNDHYGFGIEFEELNIKEKTIHWSSTLSRRPSGSPRRLILSGPNLYPYSSNPYAWQKSAEAFEVSFSKGFCPSTARSLPSPPDMLTCSQSPENQIRKHLLRGPPLLTALAAQRGLSV
jgi:diguanylate cyclase (GGDEF)-like protein